MVCIPPWNKMKVINSPTVVFCSNQIFVKNILCNTVMEVLTEEVYRASNDYLTSSAFLFLSSLPWKVLIFKTNVF